MPEKAAATEVLLRVTAVARLLADAAEELHDVGHTTADVDLLFDPYLADVERRLGKLADLAHETRQAVHKLRDLLTSLH